jgi:hypothetical protein
VCSTPRTTGRSMQQDYALMGRQVGEIGAVMDEADRARLRQTAARLFSEVDTETTNVIRFPSKD